MTKVAILIGFYYKVCEKEHQMPSIMLDLYRAYKYAKHIECDKILVVTDYIDMLEYNHDKIFRMIIRGDIEEDFLLFQDMLKNSKLILPDSADELLNAIKDMSNESRMIFFYYSGHSILGNIVIPPPYNSVDKSIKYINCSRIMLNSILYNITSNITPRSNKIQTFLILDCCSSTDCNLAFSLKSITGDSNIKGDSNIITHNIDAQYYGSNDIVSISPTDLYDYTYTTISTEGSSFSIILFKLLYNSKIKTLPDVYNNININTSINIKSSHPRWINNNILIWSWMRSSCKLCIYYDCIRHTIKINDYKMY